jgi:hypothetical protein
MSTSYTTSELYTLSIRELKAIAAAKQVTPAEDKDKRFKENWIEAIQFAEIGAVLTSEWLAEESLAEVSDVTAADEATEIEQDLLASLNQLADAEQAAILENRQEDARKYSEAYDETLAQYEAVINASIESLASESMAICEAVRVDWHGENIGTVSIDYGATARVFHVLDLVTTNPVIKVITSNGTEIDSRWQSTANNRYIKAVREAIPAKIADMVNAICEHSMSRHGQHVAPPDYIYAGGDGEGERRGGNGNGDDRGRLTSIVTSSDWPYEIYLF